MDYIKDAIEEFKEDLDLEYHNKLRLIELKILVNDYKISLLKKETEKGDFYEFIKNLSCISRRFQQLFSKSAFDENHRLKDWVITDTLEEIAWFLKNTNFFEEDHFEGIYDHRHYFLPVVHIFSEIAGPSYFICPDCGTIIIEDPNEDFHDSQKKIVCPLCNAPRLKTGGLYNFVDPTNPEYKDLYDYINSQISWTKKYNFHIGYPEKVFKIGKIVPCIKTKNSAYDGGYKHHYFKLGFYPYRVWCDITRLPYVFKNWFQKTFQPAKYQERIDRLFGKS